MRDEKVAGEKCHAQGDHRWWHRWGWLGVSGEGAHLPSGQGRKEQCQHRIFSFSRRRKAVNCVCPGKDKCKVCVFQLKLCL